MIYLDNSATTPLSPSTKQFIINTLDTFGNPSSLHQDGIQANQLQNLSMRTQMILYSRLVDLQVILLLLKDMLLNIIAYFSIRHSCINQLWNTLKACIIIRKF